ncbi:MAG: hypothetical protein NUV55_00210 [Sulfuricaulis sp.]|uniref:hypothetical protein n=1 Tax=Sulfuricaulis sp. TaxID=2003553 RepID=UPI0025D05878|nr:hypothetical protein [Sulfuricaulis sp.]MCR4345621.1 hypothetical protein [Sulfuricaulis sp.]
MKQVLYFIPLKRILPAVLAGLGLLLSGCASFRETTCAQFEENRQEADYTTQYHFLESDSETAARNFKSLPKDARAVVRLYKMRVEIPKIAPCNHLIVYKEFYLQRKTGGNLALEEVREFYTADGALIATKVETIGNQLRTSGYYIGDTSLPIPEKAPPGKYRIVSKLVLKAKNTSRTTLLAKTSVNFQVVSRK